MICTLRKETHVLHSTFSFYLLMYNNVLVHSSVIVPALKTGIEYIDTVVML
jgi:hypothetical protein